MKTERYLIKLLPVENLFPHPLQNRIPEMSDDNPRFQGWVKSIRERGLDEPLKVTKAGLVADGRHRLRAAKLAGLNEVPCEVVADEDVIKIIIASKVFSQRLNKSQLAWAMYGAAEEAAAIGKKTRSNLKGSKLALEKDGQNLKEFADDNSLSYSYLKYALQLERLFVANEDAITKWQAKFEDTPLFDLYGEIPIGDQWNVWREKFVKDIQNTSSKLLKENFWLHDLREDLDKTPPPNHQRSEFLPKLMDDDKAISLPQIVKGVLGQNKTKGDGRRDKEEADPNEICGDITDRVKMWSDTFSKWKEMTDGGRKKVISLVERQMIKMPDEVKAAIQTLLKGS